MQKAMKCEKNSPNFSTMELLVKDIMAPTSVSQHASTV
jgi:hypothetical protein